MARRQFAKIIWYAEYRVIHDDEKKYNQWIVTKQKKKIAEFADYPSCLYYLTEIIGRKYEVIA